MKIIEYFGCENKSHWLDEIRKSDWRAAEFLVSLITENKIRETLGDDTKLFILTDGDNAAAFLTLSRKDCIDDFSLFPWAGFVYTYPEYRGNRFSGRLLEYAADEARRQGYHALYVCTDETGLYEKYGFEYMENRTDVWGDDSRIYVRRL